MHLLELVDLADQANKLPSMVSGGQRQRAAIARALATDPPLLVADEPTGNLDAETAAQVFDLFLKLVEEQGKTMLMVTHDQELAAQIPRKIEIVNGRIANDIRRRPSPAVPMPSLVLNGNSGNGRLANGTMSPGKRVTAGKHGGWSGNDGLFAVESL